MAQEFLHNLPRIDHSFNTVSNKIIIPNTPADINTNVCLDVENTCFHMEKMKVLNEQNVQNVLIGHFLCCFSNACICDCIWHLI